MVHVGLDTAGRDRIDGDPLIPTVDRHAADERLDRTLAGRVDGMFRHALGLARDGAHQDDPPADLEVLIRFPGDEELAPRVDLEDTVVFLLGDVFEMAEGDDAGVGADNVELAEVLDSRVHQVDDLFDVGDVGFDGNGVGAFAEGADLLDDFFGSFGAVGVVDNDFGAPAGEFKSGFSADAAACQKKVD